MSVYGPGTRSRSAARRGADRASDSKPVGLPARAKLWIASIDEPNKRDFEVCAQYNPKELQIDKQIPWGDDKNKDGQPAPSSSKYSRQPELECNSAAQRTMQIELLFDGYEEGESVQSDVDRLEKLSSVRQPGPGKHSPEMRRPHHCIIVWGAQGAKRVSRNGKQQPTMPPFRCVIESLSTKYMMWDTDGIPLRAICTIKVKEVDHLSQTSKGPDYGAKERLPDWARRKMTPRYSVLRK